jgi:hypothetical protein
VSTAQKTIASIAALAIVLAIVPCLCGTAMPDMAMASADMDCHMVSDQNSQAPCCCSEGGAEVQAASHTISPGILPHPAEDLSLSVSLKPVPSYECLPGVTQVTPNPRVTVPSESPPLYLLNAVFII